jgi:nucleotide-binding universal stress UspA family protein
MSSVKKILCAIDFTERSYNALEKAVEIASKSSAELHLVHVVPRQQHLEEYRSVACSLPDHIESRMILDSYLKLAVIIEQRIPKDIKARLCIRLGDPALEIVHSAITESADLIVLGKEESKGWRRFIAHTVTDKVIRQASCPVVAIQSVHH